MLRLGSICTKIGSGATPRGGSEVYLSNGTALIRSQNVYNDGFRADGLAFISDKHAAQLIGVEVSAGDVLLNITGDSVARTCRVPENVLPARVKQHVAIIRPNPADLDPRFLHFHLISPTKQAEMLSLAGAGATRNALTKAMIENFEVPAPSLEKQRAIASVLGALDDKIEQNRRTAQTLERLARTIFHAWFVDFEPVKAKAAGATSFPSMPQPVFDALPDRFAESDIGPVPATWSIIPVADAFEVNPSRKLRKGDTAPYLDMKNMPTDGHAPAAWSEREFGSGMKFINGDILLARITPCLENGKTAFVDFLDDGQVGWGSTEYIVLRPKPPLSPIFGYCLARSTKFRDHAVANMTGTSGRQRVAASAMDHFFIAVPSHEIASGFTQSVEPMFQSIRASVNESRKLAELRDYLLPKLLSGEVRVRDAERMTAAPALDPSRGRD